MNRKTTLNELRRTYIVKHKIKTKAEFFDHANIKKQYWSQWVRGTQLISFAYSKKLGKLFEVSPLDIFSLNFEEILPDE